MSVLERIERGELCIGIEDGSVCMTDHEAVAELLSLAQIGERMQWVPVSERLPGKYKNCILQFKSMDVGAGYLCHDNKWRSVFDNRYVDFDRVVRWMPLPKEGEQK